MSTVGCCGKLVLDRTRNYQRQSARCLRCVETVSDVSTHRLRCRDTSAYGLGAVAGGLVASSAQAPLLHGLDRTASWLIGNALGAPFVVPGLVISWFAPENITVAAPLWLIGLVGGLLYSLASGFGLTRGTSTWST
jgi:hypothetical protein